MANRWTLTDEVKEKFMPVIQEFISKLESMKPEESSELLEIDLSDTELNPFTLVILLESIGYEQTNQNDNGWQMDYWITMCKEGFKPLLVKGTGITFELRLSEKD
ncbi:hypothetical protein NDS46_31230 (plasmid) [Paenibacillus thiaminolyticus]|uniref:hypothetical protein n=1 Tax=Paenibacillus thiaminolyticus TaxID=49283 RepID=UPI00232E2306|nr:hypothetical protein [Paenibacillus thiaminolyticus]WCF11432.1 hypothetical protein NDS46_31230 [Paenibacillus thiaminolyticus]